MAGKSKLVPLNMRVAPEVRRRIEAAAENAGHSLTQEVVQIINRDGAAHAVIEQAMGGKEMFALFQVLAGIARGVESQTGRAWNEDYETSIAVQSAWEEFLLRYATRVGRVDIREFYGPESSVRNPGDPPTAPTPPKRPPGGQAWPDMEEAMDEYEKKSERFESEALDWMQKSKDWQQKAKESIDGLNRSEEARRLGKEVGESWDLPSPKQEGSFRRSRLRHFRFGPSGSTE